MFWKILGYRLLGAGVIILTTLAIVLSVHHYPDGFPIWLFVILVLMITLIMSGVASWFIHKAGRPEWERP